MDRAELSGVFAEHLKAIQKVLTDSIKKQDCLLEEVVERLAVKVKGQQLLPRIVLQHD